MKCVMARWPKDKAFGRADKSVSRNSQSFRIKTSDSSTHTARQAFKTLPLLGLGVRSKPLRGELTKGKQAELCILTSIGSKLAHYHINYPKSGVKTGFNLDPLAGLTLIYESTSLLPSALFNLLFCHSELERKLLLQHSTLRSQ